MMNQSFAVPPPGPPPGLPPGPPPDTVFPPGAPPESAGFYQPAPARPPAALFHGGPPPHPGMVPLPGLVEMAAAAHTSPAPPPGPPPDGPPPPGPPPETPLFGGGGFPPNFTPGPPPGGPSPPPMPPPMPLYHSTPSSLSSLTDHRKTKRRSFSYDPVPPPDYEDGSIMGETHRRPPLWASSIDGSASGMLGLEKGYSGSQDKTQGDFSVADTRLRSETSESEELSKGLLKVHSSERLVAADAHDSTWSRRWSVSGTSENLETIVKSIAASPRAFALDQSHTSLIREKASLDKSHTSTMGSPRISEGLQEAGSKQTTDASLMSQTIDADGMLQDSNPELEEDKHNDDELSKSSQGKHNLLASDAELGNQQDDELPQDMYFIQRLNSTSYAQDWSRASQNSIKEKPSAIDYTFEAEPHQIGPPPHSPPESVKDQIQSSSPFSPPMQYSDNQTSKASDFQWSRGYEWMEWRRKDQQKGKYSAHFQHRRKKIAIKVKRRDQSQPKAYRSSSAITGVSFMENGTVAPAPVRHWALRLKRSGALYVRIDGIRGKTGDCLSLDDGPGGWWHPMLIKVSEGFLRFYRGPKSKRADIRIELNQVELLASTPDGRSCLDVALNPPLAEAEKPLCFQIKAKGITYTFKARGEREAERWVGWVCQAMAEVSTLIPDGIYPQNSGFISSTGPVGPHGYSRADLVRSHLIASKVSLFQIQKILKWLECLNLCPSGFRIETLGDLFQDGILLCLLMRRLLPEVIMEGFHQRPKARNACITNIEIALGLIWRNRNIASKRIPTAAEIYEKNTSKICILLQEIFEVYVVRDIQQNAPYMVKWYNCILQQYNRQLPAESLIPPHAGMTECFQDGVSIFCVLYHFCGPLNSFTTMLKRMTKMVELESESIYEHPQNLEQYRKNIAYCFSFLRSLEIPCLWEVTEWVSQLDHDFLMVQLGIIFNYFRAVPFSRPPPHKGSVGVEPGESGNPKVVGLSYKAQPNDPLISNPRKAVLLGASSSGQILTLYPILNQEGGARIGLTPGMVDLAMMAPKKVTPKRRPPPRPSLERKMTDVEKMLKGQLRPNKAKGIQQPSNTSAVKSLSPISKFRRRLNTMNDLALPCRQLYPDEFGKDNLSSLTLQKAHSVPEGCRRSCSSPSPDRRRVEVQTTDRKHSQLKSILSPNTATEPEKVEVQSAERKDSQHSLKSLLSPNTAAETGKAKVQSFEKKHSQHSLESLLSPNINTETEQVFVQSCESSPFQYSAKVISSKASMETEETSISRCSSEQLLMQIKQNAIVDVESPSKLMTKIEEDFWALVQSQKREKLKEYRKSQLKVSLDFSNLSSDQKQPSYMESLEELEQKMQDLEQEREMIESFFERLVTTDFYEKTMTVKDYEDHAWKESVKERISALYEDHLNGTIDSDLDEVFGNDLMSKEYLRDLSQSEDSIASSNREKQAETEKVKQDIESRLEKLMKKRSQRSL